MKITDKYVFFFSGRDVFSNFYKAPYVSDDDIAFCCSEQEFMFRKAEFFEDYDIADEILEETNPAEIKKLGRSVCNFDEKEWSRVSYRYMFDAVLAKFSDNAAARKILLSQEFDGKEFVEASKFDRIWGCGLSEDNPRILDKKNWPGKNQLGQILNKVRDKLLNETK